MNIRNKWFLVLAGLATASLVFAAACGGDDDDDSGDGGETPAATSDSGSGDGDKAPADQQTIVVAMPEPQFLDPQKSNFEQDIGVQRMLFRGLYNLRDDGEGGVEIVDGMADGEPQVRILDGAAGGLAAPSAQAPAVYTIKIKSDVKWSDGEPVTADDFVFGMQRACDPALASPYQYLLGAGFGDLAGCDTLAKNTDPAQVETLKAAIGAKAIDDTTLELTLAKEIPTFKQIFALWTTFPAPRHVVEANPDTWTAPENIVTNGPFVLTEYVAADHLTVVPNTEWTAGTTPTLQEIQVKFVDDLSAAFRAFQTDELDITEILATDIAVAEGQGLEDSVLVVPSARITTIETQMTDPVLANFGVRLAISQAIDRTALVDSVYDGVHTPAYYWVVEGLTGHQGSDPFEATIGYDPEAAPQTLADAGFPNGEGIPTLRWTARDTEQRRNEFAFVQQALKDTLNIDIEAQFVDSQTRSALFNAEDFQLFPGGWQLDYPDIENPLGGLFNTDGGNNKYNCSNPDVDAAFEAASTATDEEARISAYQDMETAIVENLCGVIPLYQDARPFVVNTKIGGLVANGTIDAGLPGNYAVEDWYVKAE